MPDDLKMDLSVFADMSKVANMIAEGQGITFDKSSIEEIAERLLEIKRLSGKTVASFKPKTTTKADILKLLKEDENESP